MPPARVVPTLYPSKDNQPCFGLGLPAASSYQLTLQAGKEALGHSVVIRVAHGSHGWAYAHFLAAVAKGNAGVLAALIGMMNYRLWLSRHQSPVQRLYHQVRGHALPEGPAHHLAAVHIDDYGQIQESCQVGM